MGLLIRHKIPSLSILQRRKAIFTTRKNLHVVAAVAGSRVIFLEDSFFTVFADISLSFFRRLYGTNSRTGPL